MTQAAFSREYIKAVVVAITAAFAYIIAIAWSDALSKYVEKVAAMSPFAEKIIAAMIITLISVVGLIVVAWFTRDLDKV